MSVGLVARAGSVGAALRSRHLLARQFHAHQVGCAPIPAPTTTSTSTTTTSTSTTTSTTSTTTSTSPTSSTTASPTTTSESTTTSAPTTTTSATTTTLAPVAPVVSSSYDLVEANGSVHGFGGAGYYGEPKATKKLPPIIGAAPTIDGYGYWLATKRGNIFNFGDAKFFGSPVHIRMPKPITAFAATPDSGGYWTVTARGNIYNFGDAAFCGSPVHVRVPGTIVGISPTPDGGGYVLATSTGVVYHYGDAGYYGDKPGRGRLGRVVGIAETPDGKGYWLACANGAIFNFGDAGFYGSPIHVRLPAPVISITSTTDGAGYWVTTARGNVYQFGDAKFVGSLAAHQPKRPNTVVAIAATVSATSSTVIPLPANALGYDISNFQCKKAGSSSLQSGLPTTSSLTVIEVAGWLDNADNSCIAAEASYATQAAGLAGTPYELYLFMNSPDSTASATTMDASGPKGICADLSAAAAPSCRAYNYGFNGARSALSYANGQGVHSSVWWLDVENDALAPGTMSNFGAGEYWSGSTALNALTLQGAIDALRQSGIIVGIYSTSVQFPRIMGSYVPAGGRVPLWVAGAPWTNPPYSSGGLPSESALSAWCAGTAVYSGTKRNDIFANGVPWLLQETPGSISSPYGLDPDYTC